MEDKEKDKLAAVIEKGMNRQLLYYLDICTRCSICKDACHQYVSTGDVLYLPAYRAELIRRVYRKYFTNTGKFLPSVVEGIQIDDKLLDELYQATYACTGCRRCMYYCPFSIDTTWFLAVAKAMLIAAGQECKILGELAAASISKGENIDMFKDLIIDMLKDTEKELQQKVGDPEVVLPIDKEDVEMLYVALAGTHTILPAAIILHQAQASWSLSMFEASNYGYFLGDVQQAKAIAKRIIDEAERLKVKELVITECGHAYKVMKFLYEAWSKKKMPYKVTGIVELMARYIKEGRIKIKEGSVNEVVTYHDPCQVGRNAGFFDEPRYIVKLASKDYREMAPSREKNWCCGGGGGLVAEPDMEELRIKTGVKKVEQIKQTGAETVVSPCENCRLQLGTLNEKYDMGIKIVSMMDFVVEAMQLPAVDVK
jgi:Fe-S oxidoreductase